MNWLSMLTFANPAALLALIALPAIWWLLRAVPPAPRRVRFAPFRILMGLRKRREEAARTPWWLVALRLLLAALLITAVAGPRLAPQQAWLGKSASGPLLIVIDDGWAAARNWRPMSNALRGLLEEAERNGRPVILATTTGAATGKLLAERAGKVMARIAAMKPRALDPDRRALLGRLGGMADKPGLAVWLSDGMDYGHGEEFAAGLAALASDARVRAPSGAELPLALLPPLLSGSKLEAVVARPGGSRKRARVILRARNGRPLADGVAEFRASARKAYVALSLPLAIRNEAARLTIAGEEQAGAVWLFDDRFRRKSVLVLSGETRGRGQPLLSPSYYVVRALQPLAEVSEAGTLTEMGERLDSSLSMLVLADVGRLDPALRGKLRRWVSEGGVLLRFSGPRLANMAGSETGDEQPLVPVELRAGGRQLGAALSWEKPQGLAPFPRKSPLAGLAPDKEVKVSRQVLAEPGPELAERTWAMLEDGTPLITARREGAGLIVLVHTTADPQWSDLPMSGLFVDILARILDLAPAARPPGVKAGKNGGAADAGGKAAARGGNAPWVPLKALDGFGQLVTPPLEARPLRANEFAQARPSPRHPAGIYGLAGATRALNVGHRGMKLKALPRGLVSGGYDNAPARDFTGGLFTAAFGLFLLDGLAMLWLSGALRRRGAVAALMAALALAPLLAAVPSAVAQDAGKSETGKSEAADAAALAFAMKATDRVRLAYVLTGDRRVDEISRAGLSGLSRFLTRRTSVEPGEPLAVDIERDEIAFFPLLYWPVLAGATALPPRVVAKLDVFLKNGGTILFDTRDAPDAALSGGPTPQQAALRRILSGLDIPPLEPAPKRHVLTRSFYLLKGFAGRYDESPLWVEATSAGREREKLSTGNADGVSAILITGNDMAGAWALDDAGRPLFPAVPGGARQREMAIRAGINIVMYALTGNYKADQVHIPVILRRLGQ